MVPALGREPLPGGRLQQRLVGDRRADPVHRFVRRVRELRGQRCRSELGPVPVASEAPRPVRTSRSSPRSAGRHCQPRRPPIPPRRRPAAPTGTRSPIHNPNDQAVPLDAITDTLPDGFSYQAGSTTGATTADPSISGQELSWSGPISVPASGDASIHFAVTVATTPGSYFNNASGTAEGFTVAPTGDTAQITVSATGTDVPGAPTDVTAIRETLGDGQLDGSRVRRRQRDRRLHGHVHGHGTPTTCTRRRSTAPRPPSRSPDSQRRRVHVHGHRAQHQRRLRAVRSPRRRSRPPRARHSSPRSSTRRRAACSRSIPPATTSIGTVRRDHDPATGRARRRRSTSRRRCSGARARPTQRAAATCASARASSGREQPERDPADADRVLPVAHSSVTGMCQARDRLQGRHPAAELHASEHLHRMRRCSGAHTARWLVGHHPRRTVTIRRDGSERLQLASNRLSAD